MGILKFKVASFIPCLFPNYIAMGIRDYIIIGGKSDLELEVQGFSNGSTIHLLCGLGQVIAILCLSFLLCARRTISIFVKIKQASASNVFRTMSAHSKTSRNDSSNYCYSASECSHIAFSRVLSS